MRVETLAIHSGGGVEPATGAVTPAIHLSTIFERDRDGEYSRGYSYGRKSNPNRVSLETAMTALDGGAGAVAFSSGSAAATAIFLALDPGAHVVAPADAYYGSRAILADFLAQWGVEVTLVDTSDIEAVRRAMRPATRVLWLETPSNPMLKIADLAALSDVARAHGTLCVCDNTLPTPVLQRPFRFGVDATIYATTKYLGGHSDVVGGVVVVRQDGLLLERLRHQQHILGAVPSPFDCWLALRGLRTLPCRMRTHSENALRVAVWLAKQPAVESVLYPGLPDHPGHDIAAAQMASGGGLLSFCVRGGAAQALEVAARCRLITRATSFGGAESLIEHRASIEGSGTKTPPNLLRMSVGLEHPDDLIDDLTRALATLTA
jgi:cystathionine gamma-synthase